MHVRQRDCRIGQKQPFVHCAAFPASDRREGRIVLKKSAKIADFAVRVAPATPSHSGSARLTASRRLSGRSPHAAASCIVH